MNDYFILYYEGHGTVLRDPDFQVWFHGGQEVTVMRALFLEFVEKWQYIISIISLDH